MRDALSLLDQVLAFGGGRALESEVRALLGTLDRRHVEAILEALAARDGGALMDCVGRLDERAPDYDQALGELAAALQRMALLQALPDLRGEDEEHDAMLAALAAKFAPEDLQLLYQIAIMARRTSISRPTRAAASKWRCSGCWRSSRRHRRPGPALRRTAVRRPRPRRPVRGPQPPPEAPGREPPRRRRSSRRMRSPPATTGRLSSRRSACRAWRRSSPRTACWSVAGKESSSCASTRRAGTSCGRSSSRSWPRRCRANFGRETRLAIVRSSAEESTPAREQARAADARQRAAEQAIESDANVRAMREIFGAKAAARIGQALN